MSFGLAARLLFDSFSPEEISDEKARFGGKRRLRIA
jgi:hypothetical protein